jgi:hypothetical protein
MWGNHQSLESDAAYSDCRGVNAFCVPLKGRSRGEEALGVMMRLSDCRLEGGGRVGGLLGGIVPRGGGGLWWGVIDCDFVLRVRRD